jgi:hypothetical protein
MYQQVASSAEHRGNGERWREPGAEAKGQRFDTATDEEDDLVEIERI